MASHSPIASQPAASPIPRSSAKSKASDDARLKRLKVGRACFTCRQKKIKVSISSKYYGTLLVIPETGSTSTAHQAMGFPKSKFVY